MVPSTQRAASSSGEGAGGAPGDAGLGVHERIRDSIRVTNAARRAMKASSFGRIDGLEHYTGRESLSTDRPDRYNVRVSEET